MFRNRVWRWFWRCRFHVEPCRDEDNKSPWENKERHLSSEEDGREIEEDSCRNRSSEAFNDRIGVLVNCSNSKANEDIAQYDHDGSDTIIAGEKEGLVRLQHLHDDMNDQVDGGS